MIREANYPKELTESLPKGFRGKVELLRYDYNKCTDELLSKLSELEAAAHFDKAIEWGELIKADKASFLYLLDESASVMLEMEEKVKEAQATLADEKVIANVMECEAVILGKITELQRLCTAALQHVFKLGLPAAIKGLEKPASKFLAEAINMQTENNQLISNSVQYLAIILKESNKTITHPLDENHPE